MSSASPWATDRVARSGWTSVLFGVMFSVLFGGSVKAQNVTTLTYTNRPRPVLMAVLDLTRTYNYAYVISYEDPRYVYQGDLSDVTSERNITAYSASKVLIPRGGNLQLTLPAGTSMGQQGMYTLLQQLVGSWNNSGQGGAHFQVDEDGSTFHIVPTEVRNMAGNWQTVGSIMDDLISLPERPRTKDQMFQAICNALSFSAGIRVHSIPNGGLIIGPRSPASYTIGATDEPAGSVMTRAFTLLGQTPRTWYLLYDPTMHAYYLNIEVVTPPGQLPPRPSPTPTQAPTGPPAQSPGCVGPSCGGTPRS